MQAPEPRVSGAQAPELRVSGVQAPELRVSGVQAPELRVSGAQAPELGFLGRRHPSLGFLGFWVWHGWQCATAACCVYPHMSSVMRWEGIGDPYLSDRRGEGP